MKLRNTWAIVCAMVMMVANVAQAADGTWTLNNNGNWSTTNNWSGGIVADGADFTATLGNVINGDRTITLDSVRTIGSITVSDTDKNYTIGSSKLTLDVTSGSPALAVPSTRTLTISSVIAGSDGLTKTGAGTLTLSGNPNQFTGNTVISDGKVALGAQYALWQSAYDTTGSTGTIGLDRSAQATPWLGGLAGSVDLATAITGYSGITSLTLNPQTGSSVSYGGVIANGAANMTLNKSGHGTQTLTNANTYSGATTVWAGTLGLGGASGTALNSAFTVRGGTLELDNSGGTWANRLTDGTAISLGSMTLKSYNGAGAQTETVGATTFAVGGKVTVDIGGGSDQTTLALGTVTRSAGAAIDFVGVGGTLGGGANSPNITSTGAWPGAVNGILPYGTVGGTQWASDNANSVSAYAGSFTALESATSSQNAQVTGSLSLSAARVGNSLNLVTSGADESLSLGSNNLTLGSAAGSSAAILKSGTDAYTISGTGQVRAGSAGAGTELIAHVDGGALTISAPLDTDINSIAKGGTGDLILSGTRKADFNGNTSIAGGQIEFRGAGFTLSGTVTGAGGLTVNLNAGQTLNLNNNSNSYAGPTIVKGGYLSSNAYQNEGIPGGRNQTPNTNPSLIMSNLRLQGGIWYSRYTTNKDIGEGPGQVQILAGTSGFVHDANSGGAAALTLDGSRELVWGSTYFNPTVFVHSTIGNLTLNLANGFDLAGSTRTVLVGDATYNALVGGGSSQLGGVIRDSQNAGAGLTKTGVGILLLTGANTFNGPVTVSQGTLDFQGNANVASANPLGRSSAAAANLLLANGTTLKYTGAAASSDRSFTIDGTAAGHSASLNASGSGAINLTSTACPAFGTADQTRTLILTGTSTGANTLAASLADNGTGPLSVNKTGTGTWVLTGASTYTGTNTLSGGLLSMSATNNLGAPSTPVVFNGGGLQILGTGITSLSGIGHPITYTATNSVTLDIANAANIFTVDQALGGANFVKSGAGTLVFSTNNTYTGQTTISGGVLQYNDGMVIPTIPLLNNATLAVNRSDVLTQGVNFHSIMGGTGALNFTGSGSLTLNGINLYTGTTKASSGTITLSHPMALMHSAVDTAGAVGAIALSGIATNSPTFGGLTGTVAVATALTGYGSVTNLTLNPQSGITFTYGGVIANGASGMTLTKTGAGTQVLQGANTYGGATVLNGGGDYLNPGLSAGTLTLSGAAGALSSTSIVLNGGGLTLDNTSTTGNSGARVSDSATITVNGGTTLNFTHNGAAATDYSETIDTLALQSGFLTYNGSQANATGPRTSGFSFNTLSRSGTATVNFAGTGLGTNARNTIKFGAGVSNGVDLGPWAVVNGADFATYDATLGIKATGNTTLTATSNDSAVNWKMTGGGVTINASVNPSYKTLLVSDTTARTLAINGNTVSVGGISSIGQNHTINGNGALQALNAGDALYLNVGANTLQMYSVIQNVGAGGTASALVISGTGGLNLYNGANTYSGGTVINGSGAIGVNGAIDPFGVSGSTVTVNTTFNLSNAGSGAATFNHPFELNNGAIIKFTNGNSAFTITGAVTGNGGVGPQNSGGIESRTLSLNSTANTFTGPIVLNWDAGNNSTISVNSIGDAPGAGAINLYANSVGQFMWGSGAITPLTLNYRPFVISSTTAGANLRIKNNNTASSHANIMTINTDLLATSAGTKTLTLCGANTGNNTFAGKIGDGPGAVVSLAKEDAGTWVLSGTNTYTGKTTVNASGTTSKLIFSNAWSVASGILDVKSGAKVYLDYTGIRPVAEFWTNNLKVASGIYNSVNATNYLFGTGSIMVGIETFKVTYNGNGNTGGDVPVDPNAYTNNATVTVLGAGTLTKANWSFGGWSMPAGPTYAPGSTFQITTNTTMSAIWRPAGTFIQFM